MKTLICVVAMSLGVMATDAKAERVLNVDGIDYPLAVLSANCEGMAGEIEAQIACYKALSQLMDEQPEQGQANEARVAQALEGLRSVAQYQDDDSGLLIGGTGCKIQTLYFGNYFHISRRNISTIDVFSAEFDVSKLQYDMTAKVQSGQEPLSKGSMVAGASALMRGGFGLESAQSGFNPRSPGTTLDAYANEVVGQLAGADDQAFSFVLVHPQRIQASDEIWGAFEAYLNACKS